MSDTLKIYLAPYCIMVTSLVKKKRIVTFAPGTKGNPFFSVAALRQYANVNWEIRRRQLMFAERAKSAKEAKLRALNAKKKRHAQLVRNARAQWMMISQKDRNAVIRQVQRLAKHPRRALGLRRTRQPRNAIQYYEEFI